MHLQQLRNEVNELSSCITEERNRRFDDVLQQRTRYVTIALEDIFQPQNASAVLRTCDCFGIMDVHIIENRNTYRINPDVALGSYQWVDMHRYNSEENNTRACIEHLKKNNYRIIATTPHAKENSLVDFDVNAGPFALFFGTEKRGLSEEVLSHADDMIRIPMYGFTESFNISVSAALCMFQVTQRLRLSNSRWQLSEKERLEIKLEWLKNHLHY
ncbi:MAG: RNA methyltransferase [Flavobacteriales bacterium]|nr:RNA methyltransferase [Flavobacteriales bacterium]MCB9448148.1 RNA methyltransferase [Flavobacteriales bacterium]